MVEITKARITTRDAKTLEFTIALDPAYRTQRAIHECLRSGYLYEKHTAEALIEVLGDGATFVDVGAHVGYYTLLARAAVGPNGRVFAFEPNPESYRRLIANIVLNGFGNVHAFNCAVGARNDVLALHINDDNEGESALWDVSKAREFPKTAVAPRRVAVSVTTLDEVGRGGTMNGLRAVKIDAEGWEEKVLAGAKLFLASYKPARVVCEINRGALSATGGSEAAIRAFFAGLGYECYLINLSSVDLCGGKPLRKLAAGEEVESRYVFNLMFNLRR